LNLVRFTCKGRQIAVDPKRVLLVESTNEPGILYVRFSRSEKASCYVEGDMDDVIAKLNEARESAGP
jgi:hypothetical protein